MGWRGKLVFLLIIYFAGFGTAIYTMGPGSELRPASDVKVSRPQTNPRVSKSFAGTVKSDQIKSDEIAIILLDTMGKCLESAKELVWQMGTYVKERLAERHKQRQRL